MESFEAEIPLPNTQLHEQALWHLETFTAIFKTLSLSATYRNSNVGTQI